MATVQLLGEQVSVRRAIDERTAFAIEEILAERDYQDTQYSALGAGASMEANRKACLEHDKQHSGTDWIDIMSRYSPGAKPDMLDPETRKTFVRLAALALAALRAS